MPIVSCNAKLRKPTLLGADLRMRLYDLLRGPSAQIMGFLDQLLTFLALPWYNVRNLKRDTRATCATGD
jgi:hypothetical protein